MESEAERTLRFHVLYLKLQVEHSGYLASKTPLPHPSSLEKNLRLHKSEFPL